MSKKSELLDSFRIQPEVLRPQQFQGANIDIIGWVVNKMRIKYNILGQLDGHFVASARNWFMRLKDREFKLHSGSTVIALIATYLFFNLLSGLRFEHEARQGLIFVVVYKGLLALLSIGAYAAAFYSWRVFFALRREGINTDKNIFFSESAGFYRKVVFYCALVLWFMRTIYSHLHPMIIEQEMKRLKYQLPAEYYREVGRSVIESIVFSILVVELLRIILPQSSKWDNKKHIAVVVSMSFVLSAVRAIALNITRGHGVM